MYKRQGDGVAGTPDRGQRAAEASIEHHLQKRVAVAVGLPVSYTHLRAHETVLDIVCRLLLEKKLEDYR